MISNFKLPTGQTLKQRVAEIKAMTHLSKSTRHKMINACYAYVELKLREKIAQ